MPTEQEYINYKDFVESLDEATPSANDKAVFNDANGPKGSLYSAIANFVLNLWAAFANAFTAKTSFASGDKIIVVNGSAATAMEASKLLELTAFDTLENGVDLFDVKEIRTHIEDSNLVRKQVYVEEGKTYKVTFPNGVWNRSDVTSTYLAFKLIGHTSQEVYAEVRGNGTIQSEYEIVSVASERLTIAYRGNVGQDVAIDIQLETECKKDIEELHAIESEDALGLEVDITSKFNFIINAQIIAEYFDYNPTSSDNFGKPFPSQGGFLCCDYVDISRFEKLDIVIPVRKAASGAYTGLCFYDNSKHPIYGFYRTDGSIASVTDGYSKLYSIAVPEKAKYIRTTIFGNGAAGSMTVPFSCVATPKSYSNLYEKVVGENYIDFTSEFLFNVNAQIIAGGDNIGNAYSSPTGGLICCGYVDIEKYVKLRIVMPVRKYTVTAYTGLCFYDQSKTVISGVYFTDDTLGDSTDGYSALKEIDIPINAKYIRTTVFGFVNNQGAMTVPFSCEGLSKSTSYVLGKMTPPEIFKKVLFPNFESISRPYYPHHDATFCKSTDKIYAFNKPNDQAPNSGMKVYNRNFEQIKVVDVEFYETYKDDSHPGLEMKSVDCNQVNNFLLVGNGHTGFSADDSYVYVFYDWLNWENAESEVNFSTCGEYIRFDFSELGSAIYAWWASNNPINDTILVDVGRLNNFFLVQLGKGTNQLEKGTYTATTSDKYNGTWRVLREWHTDLYFERAQHGGQFYKGSLYVASNEDYKNDYFKIDLKDDGRVEFSKMVCNCYDQNNKLAYQYPDGMFIIDGYMYASPLRYGDVYHSNSNKVVLKIEISE